MLAKHINISGNSLHPPPKSRVPTVKGTPQKGKKDIKEKKAPDVSHISRMVANVQKNLSMTHDVGLQFKVHKPTGEVMVTVRDESTGEVIREIPLQEALNLAARLDAMVGLIFDKKG